MSYILSVDGGGSKTTYCLYNIENKEKFYLKGKSTNYKNIGINKTKENILNSITEILNLNKLDFSQIKYYVFGLSGCDTKEDYEIFKDILLSIKISKDNLIIMNDAELAYKSIYFDEEGGIVTAGTGSIGFIFLKDKVVRLGGWGSELSDLGSGYWIGRKFLEKYLLYLEYLEEDNSFHIFNKNIENVEMALNEYKSVTKIASVAKFVIDNYENSLLCKKIIDEAIVELTRITLKIVKLVNKENVNIVISGSIASNEIIYKSILKNINNLVKNKKINFLINNSNITDGGIKIAFNYFKIK